MDLKVLNKFMKNKDIKSNLNIFYQSEWQNVLTILGTKNCKLIINFVYVITELIQKFRMQPFYQRFFFLCISIIDQTKESKKVYSHMVNLHYFSISFRWLNSDGCRSFKFKLAKILWNWSRSNSPKDRQTTLNEHLTFIKLHKNMYIWTVI